MDRRLLERFPRERTWLLPALHAAQEALGYLSEDTLAAVGAHLRVPASEVYGVASGYPEFRLAPRGAHHVRYCTGVTCSLLGGADVRRAVEQRWGAGTGAVTLEPADCFFECSVAPLLEVDGTYRGRVAPADVGRLERWFSPRGPYGEHAGHDHAPRAPAPALPERPSAAGPQSAARARDALVAAARDRLAARPPLTLFVQMGTCGRAVGAEELLTAVRQAVAARGLAAEVVAGACNGMCYAAPLIEIRREGWPRAVVERVEPAAAGRLIEALDREDGDFAAAGFAGLAWSDRPWRGLRPAAVHPFWAGQERVLLARCGIIDPSSLDDALAHGAYGALAAALDGAPAQVVAAVKAASLQGRGGAFFPTAVKWEAAAAAGGSPKYVIMNGEEGEPGIFKDRHLMEGDPHQALEGVLLAAYASGASRAILYVHGEAGLSAARLAHAIGEATAAGLVGERILGRPFACAVELRRGAGGFVLGEESALLESLEGRRAQPRTRPPFPVESGLFGKPTVINNVETLSAIPPIVARGGAWFAALGTAKAAGTKVFGLSGAIARPGVVETRHGVTLRALLGDIGGGPTDGAFLGAVVGGPSGTLVPAALFDTPMEPRERVSPGTGGIVAVPAGASVAAIVRTLLDFNARESCGKCTPCREGTPRLLALLDELADAPRGADTATKVSELSEVIRLASLCGLGQAAPLAVRAALDEFPAEMRAR